jgi:hypothetical protein
MINSPNVNVFYPSPDNGSHADVVELPRRPHKPSYERSMTEMISYSRRHDPRFAEARFSAESCDWMAET